MILILAAIVPETAIASEPARTPLHDQEIDGKQDVTSTHVASDRRIRTEMPIDGAVYNFPSAIRSCDPVSRPVLAYLAFTA